mgnify:CR=1 FL=1
MIEEKVAEILSQILKHKIKPGDTVTRATEDMWDSLKHIEIIVTLEEEFDISIPFDQAKQLDSMEKIVNAVKGDA